MPVKPLDVFSDAVDEDALRALRSAASRRARLLAAALLARAGRTREALGELAVAVERGSRSAALMLAAGGLYVELGEFEIAMRCLDRAAASPECAGDALAAKWSSGVWSGRHREQVLAAERLIAVEPARAADMQRELQRFLTAEGNGADAPRHDRDVSKPESAERSLEVAEMWGGDARARADPAMRPRAACVRSLQLVRTAPPEVALRAFDALIAAHPDSGLPLAYRGELRLWLGDQAGARADLEAAIALRDKTRWAYYGLALLANVEGDPERALAWCERSVQVMGDEKPALHANRGEAMRRLGRTAEAVRDLRRACDLSPTRLSGRLNLALAEGDAGDLAAERSGFEWLRLHAPGLVSDAGFELGFEGAVFEDPPREAVRALLERMLNMMRGNRATSFATWLGRDGLVRVADVVQGAPATLEQFRRGAPMRWRSLRHALARAL